MNSTTLLSSDLDSLRSWSKLLDRLNVINMYSTLLIIVLGFGGNMWTLAVLACSQQPPRVDRRRRRRHRSMPRIAGWHYLILLTLTNTTYLFLQFYMATYIRLIRHFDIDYARTYQLYDSSPLVCKLMTYLRYSTRLLNATITVSVCLQRLLAVFSPLHIRSMHFKCSLLFKCSTLVSFLIPIYAIFLIEPVPVDENRTLDSRFNMTTTFNLKSLTPSLANYTCSCRRVYIRLAYKLHFVMFLLVFVAYLVVSVSMFAIVVKLKRTRLFIFEYRANKSLSNPTNRPSPIEAPKNQTRSQSILMMMHSSMNDESKEAKKSLFQTKRARRVINARIHDTKILSSISASFVLLNTPYFVAMIYLFVYTLNVHDLYRLDYTNLAFKYRLNSYVIVAEIFQLANFSLTGVFYFSGRIFRMHASKLVRTCLSFNSCRRSKLLIG